MKKKKSSEKQIVKKHASAKETRSLRPLISTELERVVGGADRDTKKT